MPASATLLALATILLWSTLALGGAALNQLPPFLLVGAALSVSGLTAFVRREGWRVSPLVLLVGVGGIFGYHFLYFRAFAYAPAIEANLINYLWPLLIVVLSPLFLTGYRLQRRHIAGALLGLSGAGLIATGGRFSLQAAYLPGYLLAAAAALTWASYSLLTKRLPPFPTAAVGPFCLLSGILALTLHIVFGGALTDLAALEPRQWLYILLIGAGPMGAAFFSWDAALKRGDPRVIGSLAYLTPLLSTLNLVLFASQSLTWVSILAMSLIILGALVGSGSFLARRTNLG